MKRIVFIFLFIPSILFSQWVNIPNISTTRLNAVKFFDENTGITAGVGGIWRTTDGGYNWIKVVPAGNFNSISFSDFNNGTVVGDSGKIFSTTDNGLNWLTPYSPTAYDLYSVACPTINNKFAIGHNGVFIRFFYNNWSVISSLSYDYYDIKMRNANDGYIVGTAVNERVMNTANGGANWILAFMSSGKLNSVFCKSSNTIVAVGASSRIRISTNYGINWIVPTVEPNYEFFSVVFPVSDTGFVAGSNGIIFRSTNGGYNWTMQSSNSNDTLRAISFINSKTGWIVGNNGVVLRTVTGGIVGNGQVSHKIPNGFMLFQNYPNPFNPATKIKFSLPFPSEGGVYFVSLIVYDVLGKEVASFIPPLGGGQEGLNPGTYEIEFDASSYPSGVYFYRLIVADASAPLSIKFSETKKMILIK